MDTCFCRRWNDLPSLALVKIFCKTDFKDRWITIPLVCRSWRSALDHPDCWSSMLPESVSPEHAFIKKSDIIPTEVEFHLQNFETLIKRSGGGSAITSLYLTPFVSSLPKRCSYSYDWSDSDSDADHVCKFKEDYKLKYYATESKVLRLIANSCPNLKHISFHGFRLRFNLMKDELLEIFKRCKKLELVDYSCSESLDSPAVIEEMGKHLSLLRGIRILGLWDHNVGDWISTYLPRLQFLNLNFSITLNVSGSSSLSNIFSTFVDVEYLSVTGEYDHDNITILEKLAGQASALIPELRCNYKSDGIWGRGDWWYKECDESNDRNSEKSNEKRDEETDEFELYADEYYLFKDDRETAFFRDRAKNQSRQFRFLNANGSKRKFGLRRSRCKPLIEYKLPYASDLYVMPISAKDN